MSQQAVMSKQFLNKTPTEFRYVERSVFMKEVNIQNLWNFELGSQEYMNVPIWIFIGFQQQDRQDSQNLNNDTFCRLPVVSAQCIIGTEKYPDAGILLNFDDDDYSQGYHQIKEAFKALPKDDVLNHIYPKKISELHMLELLMLVIIYTSSIYDIRKNTLLLNRLK